MEPVAVLKFRPTGSGGSIAYDTVPLMLDVDMLTETEAPSAAAIRVLLGEITGGALSVKAVLTEMVRFGTDPLIRYIVSWEVVGFSWR
jgi:hypothetical protein